MRDGSIDRVTSHLFFSISFSKLRPTASTSMVHKLISVIIAAARNKSRVKGLIGGDESGRES
jgi:hypothetical protein